MVFTVEKYNEALPPERKHFALTLNGIGIDFGKGPLVDKNNKLHGKTFSNAYTLGEELSEKGCVLVSGNVRGAVRNDPKFALSSFEEVSAEKVGEAVDLAHQVGGLFNYGTEHDDKPFTIPGVYDNRYLPQELVCLAQRHCPTLSTEELERLDSSITEKFVSERTVLMFEFDYVFIEDEETQMRLEFECLSDLVKIIKQFRGEEVEDVLYSFDDPVDAVLATLQIREQVEIWRRQKEAAAVVARSSTFIKGYGIHCGKVLRVPGTDVHWGDPINTASKLGQDLAEGGNIIVSDAIYAVVASDSRVKDVNFEPVELHKSKVTFNCYKISRASSSRGATNSNSTSASKYCTWWKGIFPNCSCTSHCCDNSTETLYSPHELRESAPVIAKHYAEEHIPPAS
jgi:class 3 adenylate cyclase